MFKNAWFHGRQSIKAPPLQAVIDCSRPGQPADEAVDKWVTQLAFDGPAWLILEHLSGYGAWDACQLCDHQQNLRRLFWIWCCDLSEEFGPFTDFCADGEEDKELPATLYLMR